MSENHLVPTAAAALALGLLGAVAPASAPASASASATASSEGAPRPTCNGKSATIVGTRTNDTIRGTKRADVIVGLGGDDTIRGFGGNDTICGNAGADDLFGGAGNDAVLGGTNQEYSGGEFPDYYPDWIEGGPGNDLLDPGPYDVSDLLDIISFNKAKRGVHVSLPRHKVTGEGHDRIRQRVGGLTILGSRHDDRLNGSPRGEILLGSRGDDRVLGGGGQDMLDDDAYYLKDYGYEVPKADGGDVDLLAGGKQGDTLTGDRHDTLIGAGGNDRFMGTSRVQRGGPGHDQLFSWITGDIKVIDGGPGRDRFEMISKRANGPLETNLRTGRATQAKVGFNFRLAGVERILLHGLPEWIVHGTAKPERFSSRGKMTVHAGGGDDVINAGDKDDYVNGGRGSDEASPGGGRNTCVSVERILRWPCPPR